MLFTLNGAVTIQSKPLIHRETFENAVHTLIRWAGLERR